MNLVGLGLDLVELDRIEAAVNRHGPHFYQRFLTETEQKYCLSFSDPIPSLAARFAAKEAVSKALGTGISGGIRWTDIEIHRLETGPPSVKLHGAALQIALTLHITTWHLTMSHTRRTAAAVALALS